MIIVGQDIKILGRAHMKYVNAYTYISLKKNTITRLQDGISDENRVE